MSVIVTLDMYSGLPNPTWELNEAQVRQLKELLAENKEVSHLRSPAGLSHLGYRGFVISTIGEISIPKKALVFDGILDIGESDQPNYVDHDSRLELFLLETAGTSLHEDEKGIVSLEIEKNVKSGIASTIKKFKIMAVPPFDPGKWNNDPNIKRNNNCYNYANDRITNSFAQPGRGSGHEGPNPPDCAGTGQAAQCDGQIPIQSVVNTPVEGHYVALVIWPGKDYHWYRSDTNGMWSHKPGQTPARNTDNSGRSIPDPNNCDRGPYTNWCGFYHCIPDHVVIR
jgi:hypothetical protein